MSTIYATDLRWQEVTDWPEWTTDDGARCRLVWTPNVGEWVIDWWNDGAYGPDGGWVEDGQVCEWVAEAVIRRWLDDVLLDNGCRVYSRLQAGGRWWFVERQTRGFPVTNFAGQIHCDDQDLARIEAVVLAAKESK